MKSQRLSWRGIYATYRFCGHGRLWSAWGAWRYLRKFGSSDRKPNDRREAPGAGLPVAPSSRTLAKGSARRHAAIAGH